MTSTTTRMNENDMRKSRGRKIPLSKVINLFNTLILVCGYSYASSHSLGESSNEQTSFSRGRWLEWYDQKSTITDTLLPLDYNGYMGFGLAILGLLIAAGGGVGGGGILVPVYILVMEMPPKQAIPLSNVTVFGGALANTLLNWSKRHPYADRPLIDWDLILIMEPFTIVGALTGSFLNILLPERILLFSLVILLTFTAATTLKKAFELHRKEDSILSKELEAELVSDNSLKNRAKAIELKIGLGTGDLNSSLKKRSPTSSVGNGSQTSDKLSCDGKVGVLRSHVAQINDPETSGSSDDDKSECLSSGLAIFETYENNKALRERLQEAERKMPSKNIIIVMAMFCVVLTINILKGGASYESPLGIECGTAAFWLSNAALLGWIVGVFFYGRRHLMQRAKLKARINYRYLESDVVWDETSTLIFPAICCFAGFVAGIFGIGGGIVKGPLMIAMDINPLVAAASSATMILFTTFTATSSYAVFGLLLPDYALVCFIVGFFATLVGHTLMFCVLQRYKRMSYIAFCVAAVVLISVICMTIESVVYIMSEEEDDPKQVESLCSISQ